MDPEDSLIIGISLLVMVSVTLLVTSQIMADSYRKELLCDGYGNIYPTEKISEICSRL